MNSIATRFTIKDLENLSGIKAHTIRIWEKRYEILSPNRSDSNIRFYDTHNLKKLLNVTLLYNGGHKISKIAKLTDDDLNQAVVDHMSKGGDDSGYMDSLVMSMINFDQVQFEQTFNRLIAEFSIRHVFLKVFVPLLHYIGLQWQSENITPAHEHFISNLIKQKIQISTERVQQTVVKTNGVVYVLFLPDNEIHELGLLYLQYELLLHGKHVVYLGQSVPMDNLTSLQSVFEKVIFISYLTVRPSFDHVDGYLDEFNRTILDGGKDELWLTGRIVKDRVSKFTQIEMFNDLDEMINKI